MTAGTTPAAPPKVSGYALATHDDPQRYLSLVVFMMLAFGMSFEFPVVLVFLQLARCAQPRAAEVVAAVHDGRRVRFRGRSSHRAATPSRC